MYGVNKAELFRFFCNKTLIVGEPEWDWYLAAKHSELFYQVACVNPDFNTEQFWETYYTIGFLAMNLGLELSV